jgi:hypothetical protein
MRGRVPAHSPSVGGSPSERSPVSMCSLRCRLAVSSPSTLVPQDNLASRSGSRSSVPGSDGNQARAVSSETSRETSSEGQLSCAVVIRCACHFSRRPVPSYGGRGSSRPSRAGDDEGEGVACTRSAPEGVGAFVGRHGAMKPDGRACGRGTI